MRNQSVIVIRASSSGKKRSELNETKVEKGAPNRDKKAISRTLNANAMNLFELLIVSIPAAAPLRAFFLSRISRVLMGIGELYEVPFHANTMRNFAVGHYERYLDRRGGL